VAQDEFLLMTRTGDGARVNEQSWRRVKTAMLNPAAKGPIKEDASKKSVDPRGETDQDLSALRAAKAWEIVAGWCCESKKIIR
jgi:hypothetical protein